MKVYNEQKTKELKTYDLEKGYLKNESIFIRHIDAVEEQGHHEVIAEYENGGKDVKWVVDVPAVAEKDEYEDILVYVPYTAEQITIRRIASAEISSTFNLSVLNTSSVSTRFCVLLTT